MQLNIGEKVYTTLLWRTQGIIVCTANARHGKLVFCGDIFQQRIDLGPGRFATEEEARAYVAVLKEKRLRSLKRQLNRIESINPATISVT